MQETSAPIESFRERVIVTPGGHHYWIGLVDRCGYGRFNIEGGSHGAHRWIYLYLYGPQPGLHIDHLCRMRRCVNPQHLQAVTPRVNTLRSSAPSAMNALKVKCHKGHTFTPENIIAEPNGARRCRTCELHRKAVEARKKYGPVCKQRHWYTERGGGNWLPQCIRCGKANPRWNKPSAWRGPK